jgi:nucleotide-binding universal stress UspA family protein
LREEHDETCHYLIKLSRYHDLAILGLRAAFEYGLPDAAGDPAQLVDRLVTGGVRPIIAVPNTPLNVRRTLVAYSGSMGSAKALRQYLRFNLWPEATMRIVTFGPDNEESQKLLADVSSYCGTYGIRPETGVIDASPIQGLLQASEDWNADMIVMGNSHKNLLLSRVLGKTLLQVVKESDKALFLGQ